ncbi:16S rRNA (cytosine(1402)-N(4))-methyltransferase RsmH [Arcobacter sp. 15-2]|uniref:16S rRNA (cytosine(1402)-N(4))-methyltransferase RsmH n=1 Tax=Arcobacter sp. 15-2 TaxID=3374109 RepID=UPI00399C6361
MNETIVPHIPVLFDEVIETFKDLKDGYIIDCTLGYGGHSLGILESNPNIKLICNDQDDEALNFSKNRLKEYKDRIIFSKGNFKDVINRYKDKNIVGILADIGVSSLQLDKNERGFGFNSETLDMRMDQNQELSANEIVNEYSQNDLERIFKEYGEVKEYKKVASLIVQNRPFSTAKELADFLSKNMFKGKLHPATLPFQGIRIEVNNELGVLEELFEQIENAEFSNTKVAIISFHSLEDRIVKTIFKKWTMRCICPPHLDRCECGNNHQKGKVLTKKPIIPTAKEIKVNARSRSSKMRVFKFEAKR